MTEDGALMILVVRAPARHGDAVAALLFEAGAQGVEEREAPDIVEVRAYGTPAEIAELARAFEELARSAGIAATLTQERVSEDWREQWAASLRPVAITETLEVVPDDGVTEPSESVVVLERALAFGFGEHPTTLMAARSVERLCRGRTGPSVLDVGTGGGLLAIVADRAGARRVRGIDVDPGAVAAARRNAARNRAVRCTFDTEGVEAHREPEDVVVANIDARTLIDLSAALSRVLAPGGTLVLTGFLVDDERSILAAYEDQGLLVSRREIHEDWLLLELER